MGTSNKKRPQFPKGIVVNPDCENGLPFKQMLPFYIGVAILVGVIFWLAMFK